MIISCKKETENFKPTTELKNILKNEKLKNAYYEFKIENNYLNRSDDTTKSFKKFITVATINELISLTDCEQAIVRCIAFKALVKRKYPYIRSILMKHKNDNEIINEHTGHLQFNMTVKHYMLSQLEPSSDAEFKFNKTEYKKIHTEFWSN